MIDPGSEQRAFSRGSANCFIVADLERARFARVEFQEDALYVIQPTGAVPSVEVIGGHEPDDDLFGELGVVFLIAAGIGMLGAGFITLRFFFNYYIRGDKTARLT